MIKTFYNFVMLDSGAVYKRCLLIAKAISIKPLLKRNAPRIALNRGFLLSTTQTNHTCKTSLLGSDQYNFEPKQSWIIYFSESFFFFISYFLTLLLFFIFSFETF
jgi:hypothetical protein